MGTLDRMLRVFLLPVLLFPMALLAACGNVEEPAAVDAPRVEEPAPRAVPEPDAGEKTSREAGPGRLHLGGRELPASFPEQMPIPEESEIFTTFAANQDGRYRINVGMRSDQEIRELEAFFSEALASAGWEVTGPSERSVRVLQIDYRVEGFGYAGSISLAQLSPDRVTVSYVLTSDIDD
jgi:hypothetical protein